MTDLPILFSGPMVRALLAGTKTQTRRLLKPQASNMIPKGVWRASPSDPALWIREEDGICAGIQRPLPYAPGDRLWVRENWFTNAGNDRVAPRDLPSDATKIAYDADQNNSVFPGGGGKLRTGIHMPRWASRLTLTVTDVRVQRLQDISEEDALAEGIMAGNPVNDDPAFRSFNVTPLGAWYVHAAHAYAELWDSLNARRAPWDSNPWVCALTFTVEQRNIDA